MPKESFGSFAEMAAAKTQAAQQENTNLFNEILKDHFEDFDAVPRWPLLESSIPGIQAMRFFKTPAMGETLNVELHYDKNGENRRVLGSIDKNGILSMKLPKELSKINRDELFKDILDNIDRLHPNVWVSLSSEIITSDAGTKRPPETVDGGDNGPKAIDSRRLEFLAKQPDFIVGAIGLKKLEGYVAALLKDMIVWDNENVGNALFVRKNESGVSDDEAKLAKTRAGKEALVKKYIEPFAEYTRSQLQQAGAQRVIHLPHENWIDQMKEKLNAVSPREDRNVKLQGRRKEKSR